MKRLHLLAVAAAICLCSPLTASADVVWLLKEHSGLQITLEWTDINGKRQKVYDGESATLEEGGSDRLHAEAATFRAPGDELTDASYGIDYVRQGGTMSALANGAVIDEHDYQKIRLLHREEIGFRIDFRVEGPSVRIQLRQYRLGQPGTVSYTLYNKTTKQIISSVTNQFGAAEYGTFALSDGDTYVLIAHVESKGSQGVEYGFEAALYTDGTAPFELIAVP